MIDTIVLRLKNTQKYKNLIKNLDLLDNQGYQMESAKINQEDLVALRKGGIKKSHELLDILKINRTGEFIIKSKMATINGASNHYDFKYHVNYTADYIEFNFSIPKYLFGSNVLQFVEHYGDPGYTFQNCVNMEHNIQRSFDLFHSFLRRFFKWTFPYDTVSYRDVEVHRIDVCFNQVFPTKQDALRHLEYQKRLKKKYSRDKEGGTYREWDTSLMYISKRYSAKIYHKGSEYAHSDIKQHKRYNKEKKCQYFNLNQYQALADRILRYELTIRTDMLNYLHKRKLFRRKCGTYKTCYKYYLAVESAKQQNNRIAKRLATLPDKEKEAYRNKYPYIKMDQASKNMHKAVTRVINQRTWFMLDIDEEAKLYNKITTGNICRDALFSRELLKLCHKKLVEFIGEFEVKELPNEEKIRTLCKRYNMENSVPLPTEEMIRFYLKLKEIGSFKGVVKFLNLSRASRFRYKSRFKKISITENHVVPLTIEGLPKAKIDFNAYHWEMTYNPHFLRANNLFNI